MLVVNDCRVIPARLFARRSDTGSRIELLLTRQLAPNQWAALVKPGRACRPGIQLDVETTGVGEGTAPALTTYDLRLTIDDILPDRQRVVRFVCGPEKFNRLLGQAGVVPLPPYIDRPRGPSNSADRERYQTVYARAGSAVAAPTAGLHFTSALLDRIRQRGCEIHAVTLDVGIGTFQPVKVDDIRTHVMHAEHAVLDAATAASLNTARRAGRRIIAVGTTALRTLESSLDADGAYQPFNSDTAIFIHPPMPVRAIDGLITNFHLPRSTLVMLIAAWTGADAWRPLYEEAVRERYRFYSYGDAMLIT